MELTQTLKIERDVLFSMVEKIAVTSRKRVGACVEPLHSLYVRIDGYGDKIKLSASDALRRIEILTDKVSVHKPFCIGVSAGLLHRVLKELPAGVLEVEAVDGFRLSNATSAFRMDVLGPDRFPEIRDETKHNWRKVDYAELFMALNKVRYCTGSVNNDRVFSRGIAVAYGYFMCTDGFRMSLLPNVLLEPGGEILIPVESCTTLTSVFKDETVDGFVSFDESSIYLSKGGVYLALRLMAVAPPKFLQVIPSGPSTSCVIPKDVFKDALKRVEILAKDGERLLVVDLLISESGLLASAHRGICSAKELIPIAYKGGSISIRANLSFVLDAVRSLQEDEVVLEIRGEQLSIVLTDKRGEHRNVITPVAERGGAP